jgi:hypothetical protein
MKGKCGSRFIAYSPDAALVPQPIAVEVLKNKFHFRKA